MLQTAEKRKRLRQSKTSLITLATFTRPCLQRPCTLRQPIRLRVCDRVPNLPKSRLQTAGSFTFFSSAPSLAISNTSPAHKSTVDASQRDSFLHTKLWIIVKSKDWTSFLNVLWGEQHSAMEYKMQFSSVYLATKHYEIQYKKKLLHGKGNQKKPWRTPRDIKEYKTETAYMD